MIDEKKLIEELTDLIVKHYCKPSGCEDCLCAFEYGTMEESCEDYLEYNKLAKKIYNEFVVKIIDQKPPAVGIDKQKLIEELENTSLDVELWTSMKPHEIVSATIEAYLNHAIKIIESQPPADVPDTNVGEWIPCSERLPDKSGTYLVTQERYRLEDREYKHPVAVETAFAEFNFMDDVWNRARFLKVTAWHPLPDPYRGDTNG